MLGKILWNSSRGEVPESDTVGLGSPLGYNGATSAHLDVLPLATRTALSDVSCDMLHASSKNCS